MSEKNTDRYMQNAYEEVFNHEYHTESNSELFDSLIPDGWDIIDNLLLIIENKRLIKDKTKGRDQLFKYYDNIRNNHYQTYLILGLGNNKKSFKYVIYDSNKKLTKLTLKDIHDSLKINDSFNQQEIRNLNQYLYDNSINLSKSQKTLFIASVLIALKLDENILSDYDESTNSFLIADKMITTINKYYDDSIFASNFQFIKKSIHNKHLYHIFTTIKNDIKKYGKDILNQFYSEFCIWDKNNDGKLGIVLTPDDIVELMINKSFEYYYYFNGKVNNPSLIDFCTGTGSFLIKGSKFTSELYGCECGDERYSLAKCNFILHNLNYNNLRYNSCFNEPYNSNSFDICVINPPFSNKCTDEMNPNNKTNWKVLTKEQRFIMYQVELLKENGIGCCIVPRNNFNNNIKANNEFKKNLMNYCQILEVITCNNKVFVPNANVECTILIFRKYNNNEIINKSLDTKPLNTELNYQTKIINYSDDGYKIKKNIRLYDHKPIIREQLRILKPNDDWNYQNNNLKDINIKQLVDTYNIDYYCSLLKLKLRLNEEFKINLIRVKLGDLLEIIKVKTLITEKCNDGNYPLYGATKQNNPVKFINEYSINTYEYDDVSVKLNGVLCINKTGNGGAGICFKRKGIFGINPSVMICKMKYYLNNCNCALLSIQLHNIFNRSNTLANNKLNDVKVDLIVNDYFSDFNMDYVIENKEVKEWGEIKISEYFEVIKCESVKINECCDGNYPLISSCSGNNGICKFINSYSVEGEFISVARNGSVGSSFYHNGKLSITCDVILLKNIKNINLHLVAMILNYYLPNKYSYGNKLTIDKLMDEIISIPTFE